MITIDDLFKGLDLYFTQLCFKSEKDILTGLPIYTRDGDSIVIKDKEIHDFTKAILTWVDMCFIGNEEQRPIFIQGIFREIYERCILGCISDHSINKAIGDNAWLFDLVDINIRGE